MKATEKKLGELFEELVPASGKAPTVAGEIVRAMNRISYRNWNDGDHIGVGYGRETCNPAARYLAAKCGEEVASLISAIWGIENDKAYDLILGQLEAEVIKYLERNPELKAAENREDMFNYRDAAEDVDTYDEDEDEEY
ncbi:hypothetical protein [uncultured Oscillibacter sp.]|uniref:hypothetical protein n=1 Tax=uncultured Oscillibacter sp. TaxID=876091 RepID=UPI0027297C77|nr:hypothetical protein [uncultured Oscillibacter sp.]